MLKHKSCLIVKFCYKESRVWMCPVAYLHKCLEFCMWNTVVK